MPLRAIRGSGLYPGSAQSSISSRGHMRDNTNSDQQFRADIEFAFSIHLFRLAVPERRRTIRILLVAARSIYGVYESVGSWSRCGQWVDRLCPETFSGVRSRKLLRTLETHGYAALPEVWIEPHLLTALGFQRVDK